MADIRDLKIAIDGFPIVGVVAYLRWNPRRSGDSSELNYPTSQCVLILDNGNPTGFLTKTISLKDYIRLLTSINCSGETIAASLDYKISAGMVTRFFSISGIRPQKSKDGANRPRLQTENPLAKRQEPEPDQPKDQTAPASFPTPPST